MTKRRIGWIMMWLALLLAAGPARAQEVWFAPANSITQRGRDFKRLFDDPAAWQALAARVTGIALPANYFLREQPDVARARLAVLRTQKVKLNIGLPALTTDKHVCGDGVEGMIWPGEAGLMAKRLQDLGAEVDGFTLDLPLTAGNISRNPHACHFSVRETAARLAPSIAQLRRYYPRAKIVDAEVPTGIPVAEWQSKLTEWLAAYRATTGEELAALALDAWWPFNWQAAVTASAPVARARNVKIGMFLDSSEGGNVPGPTWVAHARANGCALRALGTPMDFVVVANWLDMQVPNLPDSDPNSLAGLALWQANADPCPSAAK